MNYKMMGRFIGKILIVEAVFMVPAMLISLWEREFAVVRAFMWTLAAILVVVGLLMWVCRGSKNKFYAKEGLACVGLSWIVMSLLGCLPFFLSGVMPNYVDAFFEIVSGFTTTGASILPEVENIPKGILYWRSFSHWLGGMGVLVFLLAISSMGGNDNGYTMHLLRAESPGPNVGKLVPKMRKTASILYLIYILLTVLDVFFLLLGEMNLFEAVCTAFGTVGTGGFGVRNDSIAGYSPYIQNVCTVFMFLCGVNFSCFYLLLLRQFKNVFRDEELRLYVGVTVGSILLITLNLKGFYDTFSETLRHASFQVVTIMTTTGFATTDYELWPGLSKAILLCLMLIGASAGSTGGGFKCGRALLVFKSLHRSVQKIVHPQKVQVVRVNGQPIEEKVLQNTNAYLAAYVLAIILSFLLISVDGFSITTNLSAVFACFNNIGPGFEMVGPTCNYAMYSNFSKLVLAWDMLAGRLEIFPILILFSRTTWKHR
ncbi:TrkH family potassium uptake protein [Acetatifactor muris]|uniref:Trk system potassium uptake protein TrkG n=1 Tax=Acetatifactor muris TaxID=879566 RepID=A0A2K4ZJU8_9FIRM|nr:TrkH family potassium uptake protein [Acetatifactor muris]MCR2049100.1 TrkH family potassium uptake protein [Acetatifactor muris]SOY30753.1 Trk system potassium uptake protein TrkG [Acetatifactor muris]